MKYLLTRGTVCKEDGEEVPTHGITVVDNGKAVAVIADVTTDRALACKLEEALNRLDVSILHFEDVVYDFIVEQT